MAYQWEDTSIEWYQNASRYNTFHRQLAGVIRPFLLPTDTLCDLGCGLGQLDLLLAKDVFRITCVDVDQRVLACLAQEARRQGIQNIQTVLGDATRLQDLFDVVLMTFFGTPESLMLHCLRRSNRILVRVVSEGNTGALQPEKHYRKKETIPQVEHLLDEAGYSYQLVRKTLEFGQPLQSEDDALAFLRHTAPKATEPERTSFLRETLVKTGDPAFPYYLPYQKNLGIFVVDSKNTR